MRRKKNVVRMLALIGLAASLSFAQSGTPGGHGAPRRGSGEGTDERGARRFGHGRGLRLILGLLDLTEEQKAAAKATFEQAYADSEPLRESLREARQQLGDAIKANNTAQIDALATTIGDLEGQLVAIHAKAWAKFYASLTPEQQQKLERILNWLRGSWPGTEEPPGDTLP